jgi:anti-sigma factor RsiW
MTDPTIIPCEEALRLLAAHLDGELDADTNEDMERHLTRCRSCFSRAEFERGLKSELAALRGQPVRSAFEERIRGLIDRFNITSARS